jgi:hypothetical protein
MEGSHPDGRNLRLTFRVEANEIFDVNLEDYH